MSRTALTVLVLLTVAMGSAGIRWGLPSPRGWALDEILPMNVLDGMDRRFSNGWSERYPPLHYYVLAAAYAPVLLYSGVREAPPPSPVYERLFVLGRGISLLMAACIVFLVYRLARAYMNRAAAIIAASLAAFMPPFVYYSALANLEIPYLFWWTLSLVLLARLLRRHRLSDYLLFALACALAAATKDQIIASYVLVIPWIAVSRFRRLRAAGRSDAGRRAVLGREPLLAGACALLVFLAAHNVVHNYAGFSAHFADILSDGSRRYQEYAGDLAGHVGLLVVTFNNMRFALGDPALVSCLVAIVVALFRRNRESTPSALLIPATSYYIFFIALVLYCYDRFVLPLCIIAAVFGGWLLAHLASRSRRSRAIVVAAALCMSLLGLARGASVAWLFTHDSRRAAADWFARHPPGTIAVVGPPVHLPHLEDLGAQWLNARSARVQKFMPDYVVINGDYADRAAPETEDHAFYAALRNGELGYCRTDWRQGNPPVDLVGLRAVRSGQVMSNLRYLNPMIEIFRRCD